MDLISLGWLAGSLVLLTFGAELLVRGAVGTARRLGVSSFFIGLTIVGFGTSTPELGASLSAALRGQADLCLGNVVGSNIFNVAAILGLTALVCPIPVRLAVVRSEVWIVIAVATLPWVAALTSARVERWLGATCVLALALYVRRGLLLGRREVTAATIADVEPDVPIPAPRGAGARALEIVMILAGLALLVLGSQLLIDAASSIAKGLGISELAIGLTVVAAGTSAPELVTSLIAAVRRQPDVAIGNVLGSNIFNILGILGITSVIEPQRVSHQVVVFDTPVMFAAALALLPIAGTGSRISRGEGVALVLGYAGYLVALFVWAPALAAR